MCKMKIVVNRTLYCNYSTAIGITVLFIRNILFFVKNSTLFQDNLLVLSWTNLKFIVKLLIEQM